MTRACSVTVDASVYRICCCNADDNADDAVVMSTTKTAADAFAFDVDTRQ